MPSSVRLDDLQQKYAENPRRYFAPLANELRKGGDARGAIALCQEQLAQQPGHMSGHVVLAQAHFDLGELAEAQRVFDHALQLDPDNVLALRYLGDIANQRGALDEARHWYERVLELDPRNPDAHLRLEHLVPVAEEFDLDHLAAARTALEPGEAPPPPTDEGAFEQSAFAQAVLGQPAGEPSADGPDAPQEPTPQEPTPEAPTPWGDPAFARSSEGAGPESLESLGPPASRYDAAEYDDPDALLHELDAQFGAEEFTAGFFAEVLDPETPGEPGRAEVLDVDEPSHPADEVSLAETPAAEPVHAEGAVVADGSMLAQEMAFADASDVPSGMAPADESAFADETIVADESTFAEETIVAEEPRETPGVEDHDAPWSPIDVPAVAMEPASVAMPDGPADEALPATVEWHEAPADEARDDALAASPAAERDAAESLDVASDVASDVITAGIMAEPPPAEDASIAPSEFEPVGGPVAWQEAMPDPEAEPVTDDEVAAPEAVPAAMLDAETEHAGDEEHVEHVEHLEPDWFAATAEYAAPEAQTAPSREEPAEEPGGLVEEPGEFAESDSVDELEVADGGIPAVADAFATATMAELYLRQGLNDQALAVYRQLVARQPDDAELRARVDRVEALLARAPQAGADADGEPLSAATPATGLTVRGWLRALASATVSPVAAAAPAAAEPLVAAQRDEPSLEELLGRPVAAADEHAAGALVAATLSFQDDAGVNAQLAELSQDDPASIEHVLRATPGSVAALRQGVSFSFEQFFQKPTDTPPSGAPPADAPAPGGTTRGTGERETIEADLEDFHAWLSGLSKS